MVKFGIRNDASGQPETLIMRNLFIVSTFLFKETG